jgi:hypothetical protein
MGHDCIILAHALVHGYQPAMIAMGTLGVAAHSSRDCSSPMTVSLARTPRPTHG